MAKISTNIEGFHILNEKLAIHNGFIVSKLFKIKTSQMRKHETN